MMSTSFSRLSSAHQLLLRPSQRVVRKIHGLGLLKQWMSVSSSSVLPPSLDAILDYLVAGKVDLQAAKKAITDITTYENKYSESSPESILSSFATLDHGRSSRSGFPEAVFAEGKTPKQVAMILDDMAHNVNKRVGTNSTLTSVDCAILATRISPDHYDYLLEYPPVNGSITYHKIARMVSMKASRLPTHDSDLLAANKRRVAIVTAGTTDIPVAEEAAVTLESVGCTVDRINDAGVAGLHRIIRALPRLRHPDLRCVIVCAGMDGALPSVVGGLVSVPVIAVPTSVGYGASFGGISAMLTMLNSCSPGVGVVNIDNGFGAAILASKCMKQ